MPCETLHYRQLQEITAPERDHCLGFYNHVGIRPRLVVPSSGQLCAMLFEQAVYFICSTITHLYNKRCQIFAPITSAACSKKIVLDSSYYCKCCALFKVKGSSVIVQVKRPCLYHVHLIGLCWSADSITNYFVRTK